MNKLNLTLPYSTYPNFDFGSLENGECISEFWFEKKDVYTLGETLEIPQSVICYNGTKVDGIKFLCIFFKRFAYPCRYSEMISFGRSVPELSYVSNHFMNFVYDRWGHLIKTMNLQWLVPVNLHLFIDAIHASESLLENCLGFIDETNRSICRSRKDQCILYSGHKKVQAIKFQSVVALNGLIANLYGPVNEWSTLDSDMLADSGFISQSSAVCMWAKTTFSVWRSGIPSLTTTYGFFSRFSKNTPSKFLEQSHVPIKGISRMNSWRHSWLLKILGIQNGTQTATKCCWENVYSVRVNAGC